MKKLFAFFLTTMLFGSLAAQTCNGYYYMQNNKTITMTLYNGKGKENGKYVYKVSDVKTDGSTTTSKVQSQVMDDKGKTIGGSVANMKMYRWRLYGGYENYDAATTGGANERY